MADDRLVSVAHTILAVLQNARDVLHFVARMQRFGRINSRQIAKRLTTEVDRLQRLTCRTRIRGDIGFHVSNGRSRRLFGLCKDLTLHKDGAIRLYWILWEEEDRSWRRRLERTKDREKSDQLCYELEKFIEVLKGISDCVDQEENELESLEEGLRGASDRFEQEGNATDYLRTPASAEQRGDEDRTIPEYSARITSDSSAVEAVQGPQVHHLPYRDTYYGTDEKIDLGQGQGLEVMEPRHSTRDNPIVDGGRPSGGVQLVQSQLYPSISHVVRHCKQAFEQMISITAQKEVMQATSSICVWSANIFDGPFSLDSIIARERQALLPLRHCILSNFAGIITIQGRVSAY